MGIDFDREHLDMQLQNDIQAFSQSLWNFREQLGASAPLCGAKIANLAKKRLKANILRYGFANIEDKVLANYSAFARIVKFNENKSLPNRHTVFHELIHALTTIFDGKEFRSGIMTAQKFDEKTADGQNQFYDIKHHALNEGFTNMLADMLLGLPETDKSYLGQTMIARGIRDVFGVDLVFKAMFEGSKVLEQAFEQAGCKEKFQELSDIAQDMLDIDKKEYNSPSTTRYIELMSDATSILSSIDRTRVKTVKSESNAYERYLNQPTMENLTAEQKEMLQAMEKLNLGGQIAAKLAAPESVSIRSRLKSVHIKSSNHKGIGRAL